MRTKIHLYVDGYPLVNTPHSGVGQFTLHLVEELQKCDDIKVTLLFFASDSYSPPNSLRTVAVETLPMHRKLYSGLWKLGLRLNVRGFLKNHRPDWIIYPNFAMTPWISDSNTRTLTIIHDLAYIHLANTIEKKNLHFLRMAVPHAVRNSTLIATPSFYTLEDLIDKYALNRQKAFVAYPGYVKPSEPSAKPSQLKNDPFLLSIGTIEPRKNISSLCQAFLDTKRPQNMKLVLAGSKGWGDVTIPKHKDILTLGKVSDAERTWLLEHNEGLVMASMFEGFGMPVIEAMQHRKPVISTDNSSLGELVDSTRCYVIHAPYSQSEIASALTLYYDERNSRSLQAKVENSLSFAAQFNWKATAQSVLDKILDK